MNQLAFFDATAPTETPTPIEPQSSPSNANAALDSLTQRASSVLTRHVGDRRPTWAPPLVVGGELLSALQTLGWLKADQKPIARLWARWQKSKSGFVCVGFELRAGQTRAGKRFFETMRGGDGDWRNGPRWCLPKPGASWEARFPLLLRATEIGAARVADFAGHPDEQMRLGGILSGMCAICGKTLTEPRSIERGIGPECWGHLGGAR